MSLIKYLRDDVLGWYDDLPRWGRKVVDQILHALGGAAIEAVFAWWSPWWVGVVVAVVLAIAREVWQNWGDAKNDYVDMLLDVVFFGVGAALMSLAF